MEEPTEDIPEQPEEEISLENSEALEHQEEDIPSAFSPEQQTSAAESEGDTFQTSEVDSHSDTDNKSEDASDDVAVDEQSENKGRDSGEEQEIPYSKEEFKAMIEALLFAVGKSMSLTDIALHLHTRKIDHLKEKIKELEEDYRNRNSSIILVEEGESYKFTVRERYNTLVKNIVAETELPKTVMETLAVIAFKYPILQADIIKIRTNKAYDHLLQLEELGYIARVKFGRTKKIKLTQKFFDYFELPEAKMKAMFKNYHEIAKAIEDKEVEIEGTHKEVAEKKEEYKKLKEEEQQQTEEFHKDIDIKIEAEHKKIGELEIIEGEKLGNLDVYEEEQIEPKKKKKKRLEVIDVNSTVPVIDLPETETTDLLKPIAPLTEEDMQLSPSKEQDDDSQEDANYSNDEQTDEDKSEEEDDENTSEEEKEVDNAEEDSKITIEKPPTSPLLKQIDDEFLEEKEEQEDLSSEIEKRRTELLEEIDKESSKKKDSEESAEQQEIQKLTEEEDGLKEEHIFDDGNYPPSLKEKIDKRAKEIFHPDDA